MTDKRWKRHEREIAAAQGVRRIPNTGFSAPDLNTPAFSEQSKVRKSLPQWFVDAMRQAVRDAPEGLTPIVILTSVSQGRKAERYVVWRFQDFLEWHGKESEG